MDLKPRAHAAFVLKSWTAAAEAVDGPGVRVFMSSGRINIRVVRARAAYQFLFRPIHRALRAAPQFEAVMRNIRARDVTSDLRFAQSADSDQPESRPDAALGLTVNQVETAPLMRTALGSFAESTRHTQYQVILQVAPESSKIPLRWPAIRPLTLVKPFPSYRRYRETVLGHCLQSPGQLPRSDVVHLSLAMRSAMR